MVYQVNISRIFIETRIYINRYIINNKDKDIFKVVVKAF